MQPKLRRVLLGCVLSNVAIGGAGLAALSAPATTHVAAAQVTAPAPTGDANATTTTIAAGTEPSTTAATPRAASASNQTSSTSRARTQTSTSKAAVAAGDVTGIASSAAPQTSARVEPASGTYPVTFSGSASVDGKAQAVPSAGSIHLRKAGSNVEQSSPDAPGDVVLVQHYASNESDLVSLQMTANNTTKTFVPSSPVTYLQYNSPQGASWSWSATSTDGKTKVAATGIVGGTSNLVINGETVNVVQLTTTLSMSGDISGTAKLVTWASPAYRLPVMSRQIINASAKVSWSSVKLVSDVTTTFSRLSPN
ncbi:MAG: hypothetical protein QOJ00_1186 [Actinomycetota bacterium]|jgi:hypothetical protein